MTPALARYLLKLYESAFYCELHDTLKALVAGEPLPPSPKGTESYRP